MNAEELDKMAEEAYAKDVQYIGMSANIIYKLGFKAGHDIATKEMQEDLKHKKIAIKTRKARIKDLEKQIEKMKCCTNCKHSRTEYEHCKTDKHEKWELKE